VIQDNIKKKAIPNSFNFMDESNTEWTAHPHVRQDYINKVYVILHDNLQREYHKFHGPLAQSRDYSCYVSRPIVAPPPLLSQKHADLRAHKFAHSPETWHQTRSAYVTCSWSWRICEINPCTYDAIYVIFDISIKLWTDSLVLISWYWVPDMLTQQRTQCGNGTVQDSKKCY
jgi:hypothetical protein